MARSAGERLIDIQASAEMARRLMSLQRRQMRESQVLDRRTRRILHDETLPRLHTAMLNLSSLNGIRISDGDAEIDETLALLGDVHRQIADMLHDIPPAITAALHKRSIVEALYDVIYHEFNHAFDKIEWYVAPQVPGNSSKLPSFAIEALFYAAREAIRNAALHARDEMDDQPLEIRVAIEWNNGLQVTIQDNGVGIPDAGWDQSAPGHGLALHSTMMAVVGGSLTVDSDPQTATCIRLYLPAGNQADPTIDL